MQACEGLPVLRQVLRVQEGQPKAAPFCSTKNGSPRKSSDLTGTFEWVETLEFQHSSVEQSHLPLAPPSTLRGNEKFLPT